MNAEYIRPSETGGPERVPVFTEKVSGSIEALREENDPILLDIMQRLDVVLRARLPDYYDPQGKREVVNGVEPSRSHLIDLHVFQFKEEEDGAEHNRLLFVGPAPLGLGISDQSVSITKYHASAENSGQSEAIIGQAIFVYTPSELAAIQERSDLESTSTFIYYQRARKYQGQEDLLVEEPNVYGYIDGPKPAVDDRVLRQKGATIKGRTGLAYTENMQNGKFIDPVAIVEEMIFILEREDTRFIESRAMDFEQDKEKQIHPDVKTEVLEHMVAHFKDEDRYTE